MSDQNIEVVGSRFMILGDKPAESQPPKSPTLERFRVKGRKISAILQDVNTILKEMGLEEEESFFLDSTNYSTLPDAKVWPDADKVRLRWVACYPVRGLNEGFYVHIDLIFQSRLPPDGAQRMIASAKGYTWDWVCTVANVTSDIFEGPDSWKRRDDVWG